MDILPQELLVLDALGIQPIKPQRNTSRLFDIRFTYRLEGPGTEKYAWMPLLVIKLLLAKGCDVVEYVYGPNGMRWHAEVDVWHVVINLDRFQQWALFERCCNRWLRTEKDARKYSIARVTSAELANI